MGLAPKCHFVPVLSNWGPNFFEIGTFATLEAHNFLSEPLIEVRFQAKLQAMLRAFQCSVARHLHASKLG
jgi:hypothetical protein